MSGSTRHVINMANSIVGVSILSMPYCFKEAGLVLATVLVLFCGLLTKKTCMYLIRSAVMSRRRSYELLAFQVFGVAGKLLMELCLICFLIGICISFHVVMGDLAPSIFSNYMHIENTPSLRCTILIGIVLLVILPLCLLRNIDSLASMSACSIGFYVFLNSIVFYAALPRLLDGSWLSLVKLWELKKAFHVLPIMSLALSCQSNVFEIYDSLPDPDVTKMNWVVGQAVNLCCALYIGVGILGYIAFADVGIGGNIMMSFPTSALTDGIKTLFVISLAISFPLMLFPCRTSIHSLIYRSVSQVSYTDLVGNFMPEVRFRIITVGVLVFSLCLGIVLPNIEFVLGLLGSTMGVLIAIILPSVFFIKVYTKSSADRILAQALLLFGLLIMVTGTFLHLHYASNTNDDIGKVPIEKLADNQRKLIPIAPEIGGSQVGDLDSLVGRKEPAIPEPPNPLLAKDDTNKETINAAPKEEPAAVPKVEQIAKASSAKPAAKPIEPDGLHPDAIKHEEKEKTDEGNEKEVIEQKQEKILNYIEEQQKKQDEMLEILHELKDKTEKKVSDKPVPIAADPKIIDPKVPQEPKPSKDSKVPLQIPELLHNIAADNAIPANVGNPSVIHPNIIKDNVIAKLPIPSNNLPLKDNASNSPKIIMAKKINDFVERKPLNDFVEKKPVGNGRAVNPHLNKSNKHDEERKKRDLTEMESIIDPNMGLSDERNQNALAESQMVAAKLSMADGANSFLLEGSQKTRNLLWSGQKIRRNKKQHNGQ